MPQLKVILRFTVLVAVYATLLLYPWSPVVHGYARCFRALNNAAFVRFWFWDDGSVRFLDLHSARLRDELDRATPGTLPASFEPLRPRGVLDTLMVLRNRRTPVVFGQLRISSRAFGYWSTAWLFALILARPMSWRRRGRSLAWGLVLVHAFVLFRISIKAAADGFGAAKVYALFQPSEFWADLLERLRHVAVDDPTVSFVFPTFVWFVVAFNRSERAAFRQRLGGGSADATG